MKRFKRVLSLFLTVCLLVGLLVPGIPVQAASGAVDYTMTAAGTTDNITEDGFINRTKTRYNWGLQKWYILAQRNTMPDGVTRINTTYGMRLGGYVDSWIALVIKAPGDGDYTLKLTHSEWTYGAELALAYIMPMSSSVTEDVIEKTVHESPAFGSVDFYSANTTEFKNNKITTLGTYSFKADEEYVVVFYASEGYDITGGAAYMTFSKITAEKGSAFANAEPDVNAVDLGPVVNEFGMRSQVAVCEVNGYDYYFLPIKGGSMHIYNLDYYCDGDDTTDPFLGTVSTGITNAWGCSAGEDGKIYVTGDAKYVFRYDPITKKSDKLTYSSSYVCGYDVGADAAGNIYIGLNKANAGVAYYEKATGTFHIYEDLDPKGIANDCSAVAWDSQYIYAYVCGPASQHIVKVDKATGNVVKYTDVSEKVGSTGHLIGMNVVDGVLFAGSSNVKNLIAIDVNTWEYVDIGVTCGIKGNVSEEYNGNIYFVGSDRQIYAYNLATKKASQVGMGTSMTLATTVDSFATLDVDEDGADEDVIVTARPANNGCPIVYDITAKKVYEWGEIINTASDAFVTLQDVYSSNDGSNQIFVGAYVSDNCAAYNTVTEDYVNYVTTGQTDSQIMYKGVLYAGNYSYCNLAKIDIHGAPETLMSLSSYGQKRIHCLAAGEDKIFFSTVPADNALGGYLAWYDLATGGTYSVKVSDLDPALADQVILSMTYSGGYLYCGTTVRGGGESTPSRLTSNIFVFDVALKQVVAVHQIAYPYVQSLDADSSGTVWGVISKTLFTVSYEGGNISFTQKFTKDTGALLSDADRRAASTSTDAYHGKQICFSGDNVYVVLIGSGLWKISKSGTGTLISGEITRSQYALGEDGNIYYGSGKNLKMLPLNISDSDKTAAAAVNSQLDSILKMSPASTGIALATAREAYEKLTNVQKGLANVAALNAAERRYTTAIIDALPDTVTIEDAGAVEAVRSIYDALPAGQKSRVKNYNLLVVAESNLADIMTVDAVTELVQGLNKEIYLATEAEIQNVRAAYEELTDELKGRISSDVLAILTAAEAALESLKEDAREAETVLFVDLQIEPQTLASGESVQTVIAGAANSKYTLSIDFAAAAQWTCEVWLDDELVDTLNVSATEHSFVLGMTLNGSHNLTLKNVSPAAVALDVATLRLTAYMDAVSALTMGTNDETRVITLQKDAQIGEFVLKNNSTLDLNGYILTVTGSGALVPNGKIFDSTTKNGSLQKEQLGGIKGKVHVDGASDYMPLQDGDICRFYYYEAEVFNSSSENPYFSGEYLLYWFGIDFSHTSAYDLIETGESGITVNATLSWTTKEGGGSKNVTFDAVVKQWAGGAVDKNYSMCVVVTGADLLNKGDVITVTPEFMAAGMTAQIGESLSYVVTRRLTLVAFYGIVGPEFKVLGYSEE